MDNREDSENNAKVSDSAYSNSCSNSQSRRSHSSKSTHSGSNSSGSSGYCGKPSTSGYSTVQSEPTEKRCKDKEIKKKKPQPEVTEVLKEIECVPEIAPVFEASKEENVVERIPLAMVEKAPEKMEISEMCNIKDETPQNKAPVPPVPITFLTSRSNSTQSPDGFSCAISMKDGVVMYTTASITTALGYPRDMWLGRSFIDFVHQKDRDTFASQITSGIATPKNANGTIVKAPALGDLVSTMVCRIKRFKGLSTGFIVKEKHDSFLPFVLKFYFKSLIEDEKEMIYLVTECTPLLSGFKTPHEILINPTPFVMRHTPNGKLDYIDLESVPYLGYLPQDIVNKDMLQLYYPSDLMYLRQVYDTIVKEGGVQRSKPYRMLAQNGDCLKLETEWTSFVNPWSRKLEFVIGKHFIIEGPRNPDVFQSPQPEKQNKLCKEEATKVQALRDAIVRVMNEEMTKPAETQKLVMSKRCQDLAYFMESLLDETPKPDEELRIEIQDPDHIFNERDSVMLGGISPHHEYDDSNTSTETPLTYNQLNYNENIQRFFDSHETYTEEDKSAMAICENANITEMQAQPKEDDSSSGEIDISSVSDSNTNVVATTSTTRSCSSNGYQSLRLTESLLNKHNVEMEKELIKVHRETRLSKFEREKTVIENRLKKKEHLARCNAMYQPTDASLAEDNLCQGLKRSSRMTETENAQKYRCSASKTTRRKHSRTSNNIPLPGSDNIPSPWPTHTLNNMNPYLVGINVPAPVPVMNTMHIPGVMPMYYGSPTPYHIPPVYATGSGSIPHPQFQSCPNMNAMAPQMQYQTSQQINPAGGLPATSTEVNPPSNISSSLYNPVQCMMVGQPVYGSPYMYSPPDQMPYAMQQGCIQQTPEVQPLELPNSNYQEIINVTDERSKKNSGRFGNSDGTNEKTDGESSYSSFYSSFFKTDSGSNEESDSKSHSKKRDSKDSPKTNTAALQTTSSYKHNASRVAKRKLLPPWMEEVCITSDLLYQYQITLKDTEEVLASDKEKLKHIEQPPLVYEQLNQLYLDLQLQGVTAKLTLEEGATSSEASTEDDTSQPKASTSKPRQRKVEYSKLTMVYEEDAPLPPPDESSDSSSS